MQTSMVEDARIDTIYRVIKGNLNWDNLVPTLLEAIQEIEKIPGMKGKEKLELLQNALKHALKQSDKCPEEKEKILYYIGVVVPVAVEAVIVASKVPQVEMGCCWTKK